MKKNEDEFGVVYQVLAHDPASQYVNKLRRLGLTYVVLPRIIYKLGQIAPEIPECSDYTREVRMMDCLELLK